MTKCKDSKNRWKKAVLVLTLFVFAAVFAGQNAYAHCDTLDGPVVNTARNALDDGDITPLLKWVRAADEKEIKDAFKMSLAVRAKGGEARKLADMYFFETLVRVHRAGEGAPYTGLKPGGQIDPAVALADKALENGSIDELVSVLTNAMATGIRDRFHHAYEAQKHAGESVEAGRKFVASYVVFTHYVEGLHTIIKGAGGHQDKGEHGH
ncbi:MAG: DUF6448 family protein [Desulfotignum sp.]|nr:DUF6448 family protein [Desulfotignum sp.]